MIHFVRDTPGEDGEGLGVASDFPDVPAPSDAKWVGEWDLHEGTCGRKYWIRHFGGPRWTVETTSIDPVEVELVGCQFSDGSIEMWVCLEGANDLEADEAPNAGGDAIAGSVRTGKHRRRQFTSTHDRVERRDPTRPLDDPGIGDLDIQASQGRCAVITAAQCGDTRSCPDCNASYRFCCRDHGVWTLEGRHDLGCRWSETGQYVGLA